MVVIQNGPSSCNDWNIRRLALGVFLQDQVAAVEVMWTPQAEGDTLTAEELMIDYPKLVPL